MHLILFFFLHVYNFLLQVSHKVLCTIAAVFKAADL